MASDVSSSFYRAIIVPDPRVVFDAYSSSLSTASQAGPLVGVPEAQVDTEMVLKSSGTQSASRELRAYTVRAGFPGPDKGGMAWKYSADTLYRGWEPPHAVSAHEFLDYTTTASRWKHSHALTLPNGTMLCVTVKANQYVTCWSRTLAGAWSNVDVYDSGGTFTNSPRPCLLRLPSGLILCFFWYEDSASTTNQVRAYSSDDDGASWAIWSPGVLDEAVDLSSGTITPKRLRAAYLNGQVLLIAWMTDTARTRDDYLIQWASTDLGASFTTIETWADDSSTFAAYPDVVVANGTIYVAYLTYDADATGTKVPHIRRTTNPGIPLSVLPAEMACQSTNPMEWGVNAGAGSGSFSEGDLAIWVDDDGVLYMAGRDHDAGELMECYVQRSIDGTTWAMCGKGAAGGFGSAWWNGRDASVYPNEFCGTAQGGRSVLFHNIATNAAATIDDSLAAFYLGGYTTVTLPKGQLSARGTAENRVAFERTWFPFEFPDLLGGIFGAPTVANAPTITMTERGVRVQDGGAGTSTATWSLGTNPTSSLANGLIVEGVIEQDAGGYGYIKVRVANATPVSNVVEVRVQGTTLSVWDMEAGPTQVGSNVTVTAGVPILVRIAIGNANAGLGNTGKCRVWYKQSSTLTGGDRDFASAASSTTLTAGATANNNIVFGNSAAASTDIYFRWFQYTYDEYAAASTERIYSGQTNPDQLLGRNYAATPVWVDNGVRLRAEDGPTVFADRWNIDTKYTNGVDLLHTEVSPSPSVPWKSTDENAQEFVWVLEATATEDSWPLNPAMGFMALDCNWRTATWSYRDAAGAWQTLGVMNASKGMQSLVFVRDGSTVVVGVASPTVEHFLPWGALKDSYIELDNGAGTVVIRKILGNSEGAWTSFTTKQPRIYIEKLSTDPTSGTCRIWSKDHVLVCHDVPRFTALKLAVAASDTADGYLKIGNILVGSLFYFGRQYSLGRIQRAEPVYDERTFRDGTRRSRKLGKTPRTVSFGWNELVSARPIQQTDPVPNYIHGATGGVYPVGTKNDTLISLKSLIAEGGGPERGYGYIAKLAKVASPSTVTQITNRELFLYGDFAGNPSIETVYGSEWSDEKQTMPALTFRERV